MPLRSHQEKSGPGSDGTNGKTELAADGEKAHSRGLLFPGQMVHEQGALRMEHGDAQPTHHYCRDAHGICGGIAREGDAQTNEEHGKGKQPGRRPAVGDVSENRLKDGRYQVERENDGGCGGVGEAMGRNEEGKENGYSPLVDVRGSMGNGKQSDRSFFHRSPHRDIAKDGLPLQ